MNAFFERVAKDDRLNSSHISLYISLFQFWNTNRFRNPISIARDEVMRISKIGAKGTYHKCIRELHHYGYINYKPSHNPLKGSMIYMFNFRTTTEQEQGLKNIKKSTTAEQLVNPSLNKTNVLNNSNSVNGNTHKKNRIEKIISEAADTMQKIKKKKVAQKKKKEVPPKLSEIEIFFESQNQSVVEANKFFNYFQSNGWKVGGKAPMKDWKAAARNWIINIEQFSPKTKQLKLFVEKPGNPHVIQNKNYHEPL